MSEGSCFVDTNVLLYLLSADEAKADTAETVMAEQPVISVQVLNEFTSVARRKLSMGWDDIAELVGTFQATCQIEPLTLETHVTARAVAERYKLSFYDGCIAAAALLAGCNELLSEDMQAGLLIDGRLRIRNPFTA